MGNLWVSNLLSDEIIEYTASQLGTTSSPTPAITITSTALNNPEGLAFDSSGNLWVANYDAVTVWEVNG